MGAPPFLLAQTREAKNIRTGVIPQAAVWAKSQLRVCPDNGVISFELFASDVADNGALAFLETLCPTH